MGPIAISFGLGSAVVLVIAALFSTRPNQIVAAFLGFIWLITNLWDLPTGSDGQLYLDTALGCLCGLLCIYAMHKDRRSLWALLTLGSMVSWIIATAAYSEARDAGSQERYAYQLASNVLIGIALFFAAMPGGRNGARHIRRWLSFHSKLRARLHHGHGAAARKAQARRDRAR